MDGVGPLFWPFAYHDIYDYTIWGDGIGFWAYGYGDIYAGILRLTARMILRAIRHRVRPAEDIAGFRRCSSSAAMTAAKLPASPSIRSSRRYSRLRRSAQHWTIWPTHRSRPPRLSGRRVRRRRRQRHRPACAMQERLQAMIKAELVVAAAAGEILWPPG